MTLGMIVRTDRGGLGVQTHSLWRHLMPAKTMVIHLPEPRGVDDTRYDMPGVVHHRSAHVSAETLVEFCSGVDTLLTVEGLYTDRRGWDAVRQFGTRVVLVANPELYEGRPADVVVVPTPWELSRMPAGTTVLPHPVDPAPSIQVRERTEVKTLLHHMAPAMLDRNGTMVLLQSLSLLDECTLLVQAPGVPNTRGSRFQVDNVDVRWDSNSKRSHWNNYPVEADVLVLPRRYGGLCLPVQEAAACGLPNLMPSLAPQRFWPGWRFAAGGSYTYDMKGGRFTVYEPEPLRLAIAINALLRGEHDVQTVSRETSEWARCLSWKNVGDDWRSLCGLIS